MSLIRLGWYHNHGLALKSSTPDRTGLHGHNDMLFATVMHPIAATHDWIAGHPVAMLFIMSFASAIVSIYSAPIRQFLHTWPIRKLRYINLRVNRDRLQAIKYLHNDSYRLVLFIAMSCLSGLRNALFAYMFAQTVYLWLLHTLTTVPLVSVFLGVGAGTVYKLSDTLDDLLNYDAASRRLIKAIAQDEAKLTLYE